MTGFRGGRDAANGGATGKRCRRRSNVKQPLSEGAQPGWNGEDEKASGGKSVSYSDPEFMIHSYKLKMCSKMCVRSPIAAGAPGWRSAIGAPPVSRARRFATSQIHRALPTCHRPFPCPQRLPRLAQLPLRAQGGECGAARP